MIRAAATRLRARLAATPHGALAVQFIKFGMVGTVGFVVDAGVLYGFLYLAGLDPYSARVPAYLAAATTTWALNRAFTFRGAPAGRPLHQWARFLMVNAVGGVVNYAVYALLMLQGPPFTSHPVLAVAGGVLAGLVFNFAGSRKLVFRGA